MLSRIRSPFFDLFENIEKGIDYPKTNVQKNETDYQIQIVVPGLTKDELKITVKDGVLKILFEKEGGSKFVPNFNKIYTLPDDVNENNIEGKVENGILELTLPISKKKSLEKEISLN